MKAYPDFSRWVAPDCKVWEKRPYGWKYLGISKSLSEIHIMELQSHDCDHPEDIIKGAT